MQIFSTLNTFFLQKSSWGKRATVFLLTFLFHALSLFSITYFADLSDSFYHAKMGELYSQGTFPFSFPWLYFTTVHEHFVNHHFFFHLTLVPFIWIAKGLSSIGLHGLLGDPLVFGVKTAIVTFIAAGTTLFYILLEQQKIQLKWIWIILICALPVDFFFRHYAIRVQSLSLCFMLLGILLTWKKQYIPLFILGFFYAWTYGGFFYLPIMIGLYFLCEGIINKKWDWKLLLASCGSICGFIINPFFPENIAFMKQQLFDTGLGMKIAVGGEWYPYDVKDLIKMSLMPMLLLIPTTITLVRSFIKKQISSAQLALFLFSLFFFALTLKSKRFIEYWPMISLLSSGVILGPVLDRYRKETLRCVLFGATVYFVYFLFAIWGSLPEVPTIHTAQDIFTRGIWWIISLPTEHFAYIDQNMFIRARPLITGIGTVCILLIFLLEGDALWNYVRTAPWKRTPIVVFAVLLFSVSFSYSIFSYWQNHRFISYYRPKLVDDARITMTCVQQSFPKGAIMLTDDWDIFPLYFFLNHNNYYIVGLDPIFLYNYNKDLYDLFVEVTTGRYDKPDFVEKVKTAFKAQAVIVDDDHKELRAVLDKYVPQGKTCVSESYAVYRL